MIECRQFVPQDIKLRNDAHLSSYVLEVSVQCVFENSGIATGHLDESTEQVDQSSLARTIVSHNA